MKPQPNYDDIAKLWFLKIKSNHNTLKHDMCVFDGQGNFITKEKEFLASCKYGEVGDLMWVRETWAVHGRNIIFKADNVNGKYDGIKWKPSIFLKKLHHRLTLSIHDISIGRLHMMDDKEAELEGVGSLDEFKILWDGINGHKQNCSFVDNPWCWRIEFDIYLHIRTNIINF